MTDEVTITLTRRQASALADLVANTYRIINLSLDDQHVPGLLSYLSDDEMKDLHDRMEKSRA